VAGSFLAGSAVVLAYEFVQFVGKDPLTWALDSASRPFSTIGQTTNLAEYLAVVAIGTAAFAVFQRSLTVSARVVLMAYAGLAIAGTVVTQTRSAIFGLLAGVTLLVALTWTGHPNPRARVISLVGALGASAVLAVLLLVTPLGARFLSTVETSAAAEGDSGVRLEQSADTRLAIYRIALEMFRGRPALGVGPDNFLASVPKFRSDAEPAELQSDPTSSAHGWLAQVAATNGAIGLSAFIAIFGVALVLTFRSGFRPEAWAALGMLGAFLGAGVTTVNAVATDWLFWAAAGAIACVTSREAMARMSPVTALSSATSRRGTPLRRRPAKFAVTSIGYACVASGLLVAITTVSAVDASRSAKVSQLLRLQGQSQLAIESGLRATGSDSLRPQYWDTLGLAYVSADRMGDAARAFEHASTLAPYDVRYDGDLARALAVMAQRGDKSSADRSRVVAERAIRIDPNNPRAHETRAIVMQFTGDLPEALKSVERAVALDPQSDNSALYVTAAQIYTASGRATDAIRIARKGLTILYPPIRSVELRIELARALVAAAQPSNAVLELDAALAIQPQNQAAQQLRAQIQATVGR
jgi:O-antigen ligase/Flp pilus assembly protein TadD